MNIGDQGDRAETGCGEFFPDGFEAFCRGHVGCGDAHDFATYFSQGDALPDSRSDILRITRGHGLDAHRVFAPHADGTNQHFVSRSADGVKT